MLLLCLCYAFAMLLLCFCGKLKMIVLYHKICLRVEADGASRRSGFSDVNMPAVHALPNGVAVFGEYDFIVIIR